jgi:hypothetical protein
MYKDAVSELYLVQSLNCASPRNYLNTHCYTSYITELLTAQVTLHYTLMHQGNCLSPSISFQPAHCSHDTLELNNQNKTEREKEHMTHYKAASKKWKLKHHMIFIFFILYSINPYKVRQPK